MRYLRENHEQVIAIFLGLITVMTGFTAFTGALWNSASIAQYSKSNANLSDANTTYLESVLLDQDLTDEDRNTYSTAYQAELTESEELMAKADAANSNSDQFGFVAVLYTICLFLASSSLVMKSPSTKTLLAAIAITASTLVTLLLITLPFPF